MPTLHNLAQHKALPNSTPLQAGAALQGGLPLQDSADLQGGQPQFEPQIKPQLKPQIKPRFKAQHKPQFVGRFVAIALSMALIVGLIKSSFYMGFATLAYLCLISGLIFRCHALWHRRFMLTGIGIDVLIVLVLEVLRSAVATSMGPGLNTYQIVHIISSLAAVLLYVPTVVLGQLRWQQLAGRKTHAPAAGPSQGTANHNASHQKSTAGSTNYNASHQKSTADSTNYNASPQQNTADSTNYNASHQKNTAWGNKSLVRWHLSCGLCAFVCRSVGWLFMFAW